MSSDRNFIMFLGSLPTKDRNFYLLMQSYQYNLIKCGKYDPDTQKEAIRIVTDFFEPEISRFSSFTFKKYSCKKLYNHKTTDNNSETTNNNSKISTREKSSILPITLIDEQLDEKLGGWASSFSDSDDLIDKSNSSDNEENEIIHTMLTESDKYKI